MIGPEGRGSAAGEWVLIKRSAWAVGVVVLEVLLQHGREVARPDDQQAVEGIRGAACLSSVRRSRSPAVPGPGCGCWRCRRRRTRRRRLR
jgi:hypothetical protein